MAAAQCFDSLLMISIFAALLFLPNRILASTLQPNTDGFYVYDFLRSVGADVDGECYDAPATGPSPICPWKGVTCGTGTTATEQLQQQPADDTYPQVLRITGLSAPGLDLAGVIPENTIGKLRVLRHLDLSLNRITGRFPADFWGLGGSLRSINISFNRFTGSLPNDIGNLGLLEILDISHNGFSGEIPASFGSLGSLKHVDLTGNAFEGTVPEGLLFLGVYRSLVSLDISSNRLDGVIPADNFAAGQQSEPIRYLNISRNSLRGGLSGLFRLPLQVLDASNNEFHAANGWNDAIVHSPHLKHLDLAGNYRLLLGFPAGIDDLAELEYLNLSGTGLAGRIPTDISKLASLVTLDLSRNHLIGTIPRNMPTGNLKLLDLSWNNLTGQVPTSLLEKLVADDSASRCFNFSYNHLSFCSSSLGLSPETIRSAFIGAQDGCPVAVDPHNLTSEESSKGPKRLRRLVVALSLAALFVLVGLVCLAVACSRRSSDGQEWAVKRQMSYRDGDHDDHHKEMNDTHTNNLSDPFAFYTDPYSSWVAEVKCPKTVPVVIFEKPLFSLTFADLLLATSHFDRGTLLAKGKFGPVYRAFLPGEMQVAVKVLLATQDGRSFCSNSNLTDWEAEREFKRLGRVKHPNLVPLVGYCVAGERIKIAIYEYMENGTLQSLIHDLPLGVVQAMGDDDYCWASDDDDDGPWDCVRGSMGGIGGDGGGGNVTLSHRLSHHGGLITWRFRHRIALGVARALAFLHHGCSPQIIHRDVKASSVFLDSAFEPRLSDSGLARLAGNQQAVYDEGNPAGRSPTGYTPPETEIFNLDKSSATTISTVTAASDVYAFGVVLFELITSKKPVGDSYPDTKEATTLAKWVRGLVRKNQAFRAIDPKIRDTGSKKQMEEGLRIGYLCTADHPSKRPSMQQIVGLLKDIEPAAAGCIAVVDPLT